MPTVVLNFHVHQPYRVKPFSVFAIGEGKGYFSTKKSRLDNKKILKKVAENCYLPANELLLVMIKKHPDFRVSFSMSGLVMEQFEEYAPEVLSSFKKLVDTGKVEVLNGTYHHSLASVYSQEEFEKQVVRLSEKIKEVFGVSTTAFSNTELIYSNKVASLVESMGFKVILAEGVDRYLGWRSPNHVYKPVGTKKIKLLLKNYKLSDDIAFRFSNREWKGWPLSAKKFAGCLKELKDAQVINLFMDYETIGEHHWEESGIFEFVRDLPPEVEKIKGFKFSTVTEAAFEYEVRDEVDMPELTSWADKERDLSAWLENPMQIAAAEMVFGMEDEVLASGDDVLIEDWRRLTTSDHFYYMSMKYFSDGEVHKYFSPNESPFEAYTNYMNVLHDLRQRV